MTTVSAWCNSRSSRAAVKVVRSKYSCGFAVVVLQEPTEPLSALDRAFRTGLGLDGGKQNHIAFTLVGAFFVIMRDILTQDVAQRPFTK
jgi:hypothetical protein